MLLTKINMPRIGSTIVRRKRVEDKLLLLERCKFAFFSAPAGYGKTTAIIDYVLREKKQCAWFSLDQEDNDPSRFWRYLFTAIAQCTELDGISNLPTDIEQIISYISIDQLIESLELQNKSTIIVLDDFHLVSNIDIQLTVDHFIKYLPEKVRLIVSSREEPSKEIALHCLKGTGVLLESKDLSFSEEDVKEYFHQKRLQLSDKEFHRVYDYSEGWPAGIVAAALHISSIGISQKYPCTEVKLDQNIKYYFESEVFNNWHEDIKDFLIKTSFLDKLSGPLCNEVTGKVESAVILKAFAQGNSFVVSLDYNDYWYRYHNLFQDFLYEILELKGEETKKGLFLVAADWFAQNDMLEDAIKLLLRAKVYQKAVPLITQYISILSSWEIQENDVNMVRKWHESVPEEFYQNVPIMYCWYTWALLMNREIEMARVWSKKTRKCIDRVKIKLDQKQRDLLETYMLYIELNIDVYDMDLVSMLSHIIKVRGFKFSGEPQIGDLNWYESSLLNTCCGFMGRLQKTIIYNAVTSELYAYMGDTSAYIATIIAEVAYEQNNLETAMQMLIEFMPSIMKKRGAFVPAFILMAKIKVATGDVEGAFSAIEDARHLLIERNDNVWSHYLDIYQAKLYFQLSEYELACVIIRSKRLSVYDQITPARESEYLVYSRLLMNSNRLNDALILLKRIEQFASDNNRLASLMEILCLTAICQSKKADFQNAMLTLKKTLELGKQEEYKRVFIDERESMAALLERYITQNKDGGAGTNLSYARKLFKLTNEHITMLSSWSQGKNEEQSAEPLFTKGELEVLKHMLNQESNQQISDNLFLSINTVKKYNARIFDKLGVNNRNDAILKARKLGIKV